MRTDDVFNDIDSKTADRLSKEYPVLDDERKERLYAMSKRKFDIKNVMTIAVLTYRELRNTADLHGTRA